MIQKLFALGVIAILSTSLGCAMCCGPDDPNYGAYGGRWQRHDMSYGRVGSAFADAGFDSLGPDSVDPPPAEEEANGDGMVQNPMLADEGETDLVSYIR